MVQHDELKTRSISTFPHTSHTVGLVPYIPIINTDHQLQQRSKPMFQLSPPALDMVLYQSLLINQPDSLSAFFPSTDQRFQVSLPIS